MKRTLLASGALRVTLLEDGSLRVHYRPWSVWGMSVVSLLVWLALLAGLGYTRTLECRRIAPGQVDCRLATFVLGLPVSAAELHGLQDARIYETGSRRSGRVTHLELTGAGGEVLDLPMPSGFIVARGQPGTGQDLDAEIDGFLADPAATTFTLSVTGWLVRCCASLILLPAVVGLNPLTLPGVSWTFDRARGMLMVERSRLLFRQRGVYALQQVVDASVELLEPRKAPRGCSYQGPGSIGRVIALRLSSGQILSLGSQEQQERAKQEAAHQIRQFLTGGVA